MAALKPPTLKDDLHWSNWDSATSLQDHGNYIEAANLLGHNLHMSLNSFGDGHPAVGKDRKHLSECLDRVGDLKPIIEFDQKDSDNTKALHRLAWNL